MRAVGAGDVSEREVVVFDIDPQYQQKPGCAVLGCDAPVVREIKVPTADSYYVVRRAAIRVCAEHGRTVTERGAHSVSFAFPERP